MSYNFDRVIRLTQPTVEPITLTEAKNHLRYDGTEENDYITALISVARDYIEQYTGQYWASASFALLFDTFPSLDYPFDLVIPGITSVDSVTYLDETQASQTISSGTTLDSERRQLRYNTTWPLYSIGVRIEVTAGVDNAASPSEVIPNAIRHAILLVIADLYNNRASITNMQTYQNKAVEMLAHLHRTRIGI